MPKFIKSPITISAVQWNGDVTPELQELFGSQEILIKTMNPPYLLIATAEGTMTAGFGDWIIRGVKGELYPCRPDIFAATFSPELAVPMETAALLADTLRAAIRTYTPTNRCELMHRVIDGYCIHCGGIAPTTCPCTAE